MFILLCIMYEREKFGLSASCAKLLQDPNSKISHFNFAF